MGGAAKKLGGAVREKGESPAQRAALPAKRAEASASWESLFINGGNRSGIGGGSP